jgi:hypothetical protein
VKARDNPFRAARVLATIRYTVPAASPSHSGDGALSLLPRLKTLRYRAAIVGPHGSGKTTLLEDLEQVLAERGFQITHVRLDSEDRRLPREWRLFTGRRPRPRLRRFDGNDIVCLDGAEQLGVMGWMWFRWRARRAGGMIITTHRPGRLTTLVDCATSADLLDRIIERLVPERLADAPSAAELFTRHRGNLRDALRELYDLYARESRLKACQIARTGRPRGTGSA